MRIFELMANRVKNPLGFQLEPVRLSYKVDQTQAKTAIAAQIRVSKCPQMCEILYDSGRREDIDNLCFVPELTLQPRTRYYWDVSVWADNGDGAISEPAWFETGKMGEPWSAQWITSDVPGNMNFLKTIQVSKPVRSARAYVTGLGLYELYIDCDKVSDEYLTPYCNDYDHWLQVQAYDLTQALQPGGHEVKVMLGDGWAIGRFGFRGQERVYADQQALLMELHILYEDGSAEIVATGEDWQATQSKVRFANIYDGEVYDATWDTSKRCPAKISQKQNYDKLTDRLSVPVRVTERITPAQIITTPAGETVIDLGQEISGWLEFTTRAPKGTELKLFYFEILQNGNYYRDNLRTAKEEYTFIADGGEHTVRPIFTFFGFRYIKLEGFASVDLNDFTGCVLHSDIERTGYIETSNEKVNRLAANALWGQRGNFVDVPTDCPQRDERMGWTGDAQVFAGTACFNMESAAFFQKFMHDMLMEQQAKAGLVPHVIPSFGMPGGGSCAWADAACIIPWGLYLFYGDKKLLEQQYTNMKLWVEWIRKTDEDNRSGRLWNVGFHFADWLALDTKDNSVMGGTDPYFIASAYYYYSTSLLLKAANVLGYEQDIARYEAQLAEIFDAISREYFAPSGRMAQTTQTAYVCALFMGFAPKQHIEKLAQLLGKELDDTHGKLRTGFVGTAYLNRVLTAFGMNDRAYALLLNEEYPGWLYEVNMGATTVWERWNSVLPNGMISDTGMNSLNHYAYGAVMEWVYRDAAGINPCETQPGFKRAVLRPNPHYSLPKVSARYNSAMGWYVSAWEIQKNRFIWDVEIPFGATARLVFPKGDMASLGAIHPELAFEACESGACAVAPAGKYHFEYRPTEPLHQVFSIDSPISEIIGSEKASETVFKFFPMLRRFIQGGFGHMGNGPLRRALVGNPMMEFDPETVEQLAKALDALN